MERLQRIEDALNALISPDPVRQDFFGHERLVSTLHGAIKPDPAALEFAGRVACIGTIASGIRAKLNPNPADISKVMGDISALLDKSITGMTVKEQGPAALDLSKISLRLLQSRLTIQAQEYRAGGAQGGDPSAVGEVTPAQPNSHRLCREVRGADREL
jgi:type I restriction enzyme R subunit